MNGEISKLENKQPIQGEYTESLGKIYPRIPKMHFCFKKNILAKLLVLVGIFDSLTHLEVGFGQTRVDKQISFLKVT